MTMQRLPPQRWTADGQSFSVSLYVEDGTVVGMTPVTTAAGIIVQQKKYIGDHIANGLAKLGVKPCGGCNKRKEILNGVHRGASKLAGALLG